VSDDLRKRLIELGAPALADALIRLARESEEAGEFVKRMVETRDEKIRRVRAGIAGLKRMRSFVGYRESFALAGKMEALLEDIRSAVHDPMTGIELVAAFYGTDAKVLESCDESGGSVGNTYRVFAADLFVHYAAASGDKRRIAELLWKLAGEDDYGVREPLVPRAAEYLPEELLRELLFRAWSAAKQEEKEPHARRWYRMVESFARQLKDPATFERARLASWPELGPAACYDIAEVYLESGDATAALAWIRTVPGGERFENDRRDELLLKVHEKTGDVAEREKIARRIFRRYRCAEALDDLIAILGEESRAGVIEEEARIILASKKLSSSDAMFLFECGRADEADAYLLALADQLEGNDYPRLLPLGEAMEIGKRFLAASIIYRALLDSILARGISKYYTHGVRYLRKLDALAPKVSDWGRFQPHDAYATDLRKNHARKSAFWGRYAPGKTLRK